MRLKMPFIYIGLLALLVAGCFPEFSNLKGELIAGSPVKKLIADVQPVSFRSPRHYKAIYFHINTQMRQCLVDSHTVYRGYILDSKLDEDASQGELATLRDKPGFGNRAETYVLVQADAGAAKITVHTREPYQLEKWQKWFAGESGCFPELMG